MNGSVTCVLSSVPYVNVCAQARIRISYDRMNKTNEPLCGEMCDDALCDPFSNAFDVRKKSRRKLKNRTCAVPIALYGVVSVITNQFIQRHSTD